MFRVHGSKIAGPATLAWAVTTIVVLGATLSAPRTRAAVGVDGVLTFDRNATRPVYLSAVDLGSGESIAGVQVYVNDPDFPPAGAWVVPSGADGRPDWAERIPLARDLGGDDAGWLRYSGSVACPPARVWVAVEFPSGTDAPVNEGVAGPGIGYARPVEPAPGKCLLSSDGGVTFDGLDPRLLLAVSVERTCGQSGFLAKRTDGAIVAAPARIGLTGVRPNPFNPRTEIGYSLREAGHVTLSIYDARGRLVRVLVDGTRPAGDNSAQWDGTDGDRAPVASGTYHAVLKLRAFTARQKVLLVR